jgi:hypothetical protein
MGRMDGGNNGKGRVCGVRQGIKWCIGQVGRGRIGQGESVRGEAGHQIVYWIGGQG